MVLLSFACSYFSLSASNPATSEPAVVTLEAYSCYTAYQLTHRYDPSFRTNCYSCRYARRECYQRFAHQES